jgi:TRAP-type C4-dicarboxylate transport system permease small subunit
MPLTQIHTEGTVDTLSKFCRIVSHILLVIGATMLAGMMFLIVTDVLLRYVFNRPLAGAYEVVEYLMAILVAFGAVYCAYEGGHVSVDIVFDLLPKRIQRIVSIVTSLILNALFLAIAWENVVYVKEIFEQRLTSAVLYIPTYPFVAAVAIGFLAFCLVLFSDLLKVLFEPRGK